MLKKIFLLAIFILSSVAVYAQQTTYSLTMDDAIKTALENNREIKLAKLDVEKGEAAVKEAFGYAMPTLDFSAGFTHFLKKPMMPFPDFNAMLNNSTYGILFQEGIIPYDPNKLMPMNYKLQSFALANNYKAEFQFSQILFNSAVFRGIGASKIYLNLSKVKLKETVSQTVLKVKKAFYGVLLTEQLYDIALARYNNAKEHLENVKAMREQGLVPEFTEMRVKVEVENIKPILKQLENAHTNALNGLKIVLNIPQDSKVEVKGKMEYTEDELPLLEDLIASGKELNLNIQTLKVKKQLDEEMKAIDAGAYWPTLVGFANYAFNGAGEKWDFNDYQTSTVGISFSINLFQGMRTYHKVQQDEITIKQTNEQIKTLTDAIVMKIVSKYNDLLRVKNEILSMRDNVKLAEEAYKIAEDRFNHGLSSRLEVNDADVALSKARVNYTQAVHDYLVAKAELYDLVGKVEQEYLDYVKDYIE